MKKRKFLVLAAVLVFTLALLTGCGKKHKCEFCGKKEVCNTYQTLPTEEWDEEQGIYIYTKGKTVYMSEKCAEKAIKTSEWCDIKKVD